MPNGQGLTGAAGNQIGALQGQGYVTQQQQLQQWYQNSLLKAATNAPVESQARCVEKFALAREAMLAMMGRTEGFILNAEELSEKAWDISEAMMKEATKRGNYL